MGQQTGGLISYLFLIEVWQQLVAEWQNKIRLNPTNFKNR